MIEGNDETRRNTFVVTPLNTNTLILYPHMLFPNCVPIQKSKFAKFSFTPARNKLYFTLLVIILACNL